MSNEPTITINLSQYDQLRGELRDATANAYALQKQLDAARLGGADGLAARYHQAFHTAMRVVQFAVANCPPETVAGWPHVDLAELADTLLTLDNVDRHLAEAAPEFKLFAGQAANYEAFRKNRARERGVIAATAADFGPKSNEAAVVHANYEAAKAPKEITADDDAADVA